MTGVIGSLNDCYVRQVLNEGRTELPGAPTGKFEVSKKVKYGKVVVSTIER